jgi:hypothetical protein
MSYTVTVQRVADGALFDVPLPYEWVKTADYTDQFWWEEGNFACDCNRADLVDDPDETCGDERYRVRITLPDGSVPYDEIGAPADSTPQKALGRIAEGPPMVQDGGK